MLESRYVWLRFHCLAHGAEDLDLASGEVGGVGSVACHSGGRVVGVLGSRCVGCLCVIVMLVGGAGKEGVR